MKKIERPSIDDTMMAVALVLSGRSTCVRRIVGCVLVNERNHIIGSGYNGTARGLKHCIANPCAGAAFKSGEGLDKCEAIHAEANALLQCRNVYDISTAYCTTAPCVHCVKLLLNTSCSRIVYCHGYPHAVESQALWTSVGHRLWIKHEQTYTLQFQFNDVNYPIG